MDHLLSLMDEIKTNIRVIKLSKDVFDKLCQVQVNLTAQMPNRPSFSEVVDRLCNAYLEGQK